MVIIKGNRVVKVIKKVGRFNSSLMLMKKNGINRVVFRNFIFFFMGLLFSILFIVSFVRNVLIILFILINFDFIEVRNIVSNIKRNWLFCLFLV